MIPHSPWGLLKLTVEDLSGVSGEDNTYKPVYQDAIDVNAPKVDPEPNKLVIAPAANQATTAAVVATTSAVVATAASNTPNSPSAVSSAAMLPETETFYNQQIQKAIASGNIEKAMALTNEAERAGSKTAKQTFVNAVKSMQK